MKFTATLLQFGNNTGIEVPAEMLDALGAGKRPRVRIGLNGFSFELTLGSMGGKVMIPVSAERRAAAGVTGGETCDIEIDLAAGPEAIELPADFAAALDEAGLRSVFDALPPSHRKEHVRAVADAKKPETRLRRISAALDKLAARTR